MDNQGYTGFTFNGKHSSEFNIKRTSDGDRYNENLLPTIQDKTVQIPGADGTYFQGSYFTQRVFNISFAFDSLTEQQLAALKAHFGDKKIHDLIFDETPYKKYKAKVTSSATIKYIPFSEGVTNRVYKGEGSLQFTAYDPYACSVHKYLDEYEDCQNKHEWEGAAGLLQTQGSYDELENNEIKLYNPGVKDSDFIMGFKISAEKDTSINIEIELSPEGKPFVLSGLFLISNDIGIKINSKTNLVEGYNEYGKTGNIYNKYISKGTFFKIPVNTEKDSKMTISCSSLCEFDSIQYDYYYL